MTQHNGHPAGGRDEGDDGVTSPDPAHAVPPTNEVELGSLVLEAYVQHRIAQARKMWEQQQLLTLFDASEPLWEHLQRTCNDPSWTARRDALVAAREQFRQETLDARTSALAAKGQA